MKTEKTTKRHQFQDIQEQKKKTTKEDKTMDAVITIEQRIKDLKKQGLSYRKIAEKLNITLGKVQRSLSVSGGVSIQTKSVSKSVPECIDTGDTYTKEELKQAFSLVKKDTDMLKQSVADLKIQLNTMQEEFKVRVNRVLSYYIKNHLEAHIEQKIKDMGGKINEY